MMVPTTCRTSNTESNRISWIVVIVVSGLVSRTAGLDMNSVACVGNNNCNLELDCVGTRIWLRDQEYGYSTSGKQCKPTEANANNCRTNSPPMCCVVNGLCKSRFSKEHVYHLYQECSGLERCSVEARSGNVTCDTMGTTVSADSNIVNYQCIAERNTVQLCEHNKIEKRDVNIYFNDDVEMQYENQMCTCTIQAIEAYSVTMEDIRPLRPGGTTHCSSAIVDNFDKKCNESIKCFENFVYKEVWNTTTDVIKVTNLFAQGRDDRPTMIWIRVKTSETTMQRISCDVCSSCVLGQGKVQVVCEGAVQGKTTPTVGSATSTIAKPSRGSATSTTTNPSRGSATYTATKPSSGSATSTTKHSISTNTGTSVGGTVSSSSANPNHARVTADENKVPIAAIVVPLLLVLLGSAAVVTSIWFWRKRRKAATEKNTNISNGQQNVTSGVSSGRISGTDRTYDLPEEDEYSAIDGNGLANSSCESDNYGYIVPVVTMRADDTPEYEVPVHVDGDGGEEHAYSILDNVDQQ